MKTHYFIGIKIPYSLATSIIAARSKTNLHVSYKKLPIEDDLHITLNYLGEIENSLLNQIIQSLQNIDWIPFVLTTNGLSHFGSNLTPRVVYVALEENEMLRSLQQKVMGEISRFINTESSKDFNAHITIAKKWASKGLLSIEDFQLTKTTFEVNNFSVFQINRNSMPRYEEISSIKCEGG